MATKLTPEEFDGAWHVDRVVLDGPDRHRSTFAGTTEIGGGVYAERGILSLPTGQTLTAERRYLWQPKGDGIDLAFEDGRFFHRIVLGEATWETDHWCDPDQYEVAYDFSDFPNWTAIWRVKGPRKDYEMTSRYRKQG